MRGVFVHQGLAASVAAALSAGTSMLALAAPVSAAPAAQGTSPPMYRTVDLGTVAGPTSIARALNEYGQVVGDSDSADGSSLAIEWRDGVPGALGTLPGGRQSHAVDINDSGTVAGSSETASGALHATVWTGSGITDLGTLGGASSFATGINDLGQVVGVSQIAGGGTHAFLWDKGQLTDIGEIAPGDINDRGQVACQVSVAPGVHHACRWWAGAVIDLGGLDGGAWGINQAGDIIGTARTACSPSAQHGFLWRDGIPTDLGAFGGQCFFSMASGLNDHTDVVGNSQVGNGTSAPPFLWRDGTMTDLTTRGLAPADQALAINNSGVIAGSHARHAALFVPAN